MGERADKVLVNLELVSTRSQAKQLIEEGQVFYQGKPVVKTSQTVEEQLDFFEIKKTTLYVGRGAHKVEGAFKFFNLSCQDLVIADIGASTGGFTEFVLALGARKVYAIDVGHDQLALHLRQDPRVINMEGINARYPLPLEELVDMAVVDLSFISLRLTLESIFASVRLGGVVVALIKPQFEAGPERVGRKGIVAEADRLPIIQELFSWCTEHGFIVQDACRSPIEGKGGNVEYFFYFKVGEKASDYSFSNLELL